MSEQGYCGISSPKDGGTARTAGDGFAHSQLCTLISADDEVVKNIAVTAMEPQGATPVTLRMQALTAARFDDILAHVTFTGTGSKDSRLYPFWDQTRMWNPGD